MNKFKLPMYVSLNGSELKHHKSYYTKEYEYYRAAGEWSVGYVVRDGKVFSISDMKWLNDIELVPITKEQWKEGNQGYI